MVFLDFCRSQGGVKWGYRQPGFHQQSQRMPDGNVCSKWHVPPAYMAPPNPYNNAEVRAEPDRFGGGAKASEHSQAAKKHIQSDRTPKAGRFQATHTLPKYRKHFPNARVRMGEAARARSPAPPSPDRYGGRSSA